MNHVEGSFKGVRDASIYTQAWLPEGEVKAVVLVVHGLGEHSGRYMNVVNALVPLGYAVYALDHLGHGKSEGEREVIERFSDYTDTLMTFEGLVKGAQPGKPLFLLGHSMGGLIASYTLLDHQAAFRGAIISAPAIKVGEGISKSTILLGKVMSALAPKMGVLALDATAISRDPEVVSAYADDPLVFHGKTPARLAAEMLKAMQRVTDEVANIRLPFIVVQGSEDKLVDPGGAQMLYDGACSEDKTLRVYEGLFHEVCNEPECALVLDDIAAWLEVHL
jgi:acylglycerol lipase